MHPVIDLLTTTRPAEVLDTLAAELAASSRRDASAVVVPRTYLRDAVIARAVSASTHSAWISPRVYTTQGMVGEYARKLRSLNTLSEIQVREIVSGIVRVIGTRPDGRHGQSGEPLAEETLARLARLVMELESQAVDAKTVRERMSDRAGHLSPRGVWLASIYERYLELIADRGAVGPLGRSLTAIDAARTDPPPHGLRDICFAGVDGLGAGDMTIRLLLALAENPCIERIRVILVMPDDIVESAWAHHGNESLLGMFADIGVVPRRMDTMLRSAPPALRAIALDPFAYRLDPTVSDESVQAVRLPDPRLEASWIAGDIKRRMVADETMRPEDFAVVLRDPAASSAPICEALEARGLPTVASSERMLDSIPLVRTHLECVRLVAHGWPAQDLLAIAESPYLNTCMAPQAITAVAASGIPPVGAAQWHERLLARAETEHGRARMGAEGADDAAVAAASTAESVRSLYNLLSTCLPECATPAEWVASLANMREGLGFDEAVMTPAGNRPRAETGRLVRLDIDGANALWKAACDWERGRDLAGRAAETLTVAQWEQELVALCRLITVRVSTYPRDAVHIVDPDQAALRTWRVTYLAGMVDGVFPQPAGDAGDEERQALALPGPEERAAAERMRFHLACASATEYLVCTAPATDTVGTQVAPSPYMMGLSLRLSGCAIEQIDASALVPSSDGEVWSMDEADARAVRYLRERQTSVSPFLAAWASKRGTPIARRWRQADLRQRLDQMLADGTDAIRAMPDHDATGLIAAAGLSFANPEAIFDTKDLALYTRCHFRWFATRVLQLDATGPEDEAATIGKVVHEALTATLRRGRQEGLFPPTSASDIETLLAYSDEAVNASATAHLSASRSRSLEDDISRLQERARATIRRDAGRWLTPSAEEAATRLEAFSTTIGGALNPVEFTVDGVTFRMRGTIDRTEVIDDPRLPESVQGNLVISDYTSSQSVASQATISALAKGKAPNLPLLAALAERQFGVPVFAARTIVAADSEDPAPLARFAILETDTGVRLGPVKKRGIEADPLGQAISTSLSVMAKMVQQVRRGEVQPQPERTCIGCPLASVCRASTAVPGLRLSTHTPDPVIANETAPRS